MKLCMLIKNINCRIVGSSIVEIKGLYHKDTEVKEGGLFFCLRGTRVDGADFVKSAIKNGAVAIVTEQEIQNLTRVTQVIVKNARETMSLIACKFYGNPSEKLCMIGVTGTNGKTTTTNMMSFILEGLGRKTAIVGTNGIFIKGNKIDSGMTTPDPIDLQKHLALMVKNKVEYVCIEVSAHAAFLNKVDGMVFDIMVFTNLTEDHLDFFKTINNYFNAKAKLFTRKHTKYAILNVDDERVKRLVSSINLPFNTYAINTEADFQAKDILLTKCGQKFSVGNIPFEISMAGKFNISNALAAVASIYCLGFGLDDISKILKTMPAVEGRFNCFEIDEKLIIIDYAHTPDGLRNILSICKDMVKDKKVISVFGCGGNRETQKRSIMGEISSKIADFTIITTDNPRFENRNEIAKQVENGVIGHNYLIELDRSCAIRRAINIAEKGDIVVVAGKGSEPYIEENGIKIPYSDIVEIEKIRREFYGGVLSTD